MLRAMNTRRRKAATRDREQENDSSPSSRTLGGGKRIRKCNDRSVAVSETKSHQQEATPATIVAAIADTHGVLGDNLLAQLRDVAPEHVLHMGDIGDARKGRLRGPALLEDLRASLPGSTSLTAVAGNVDERDEHLLAARLHFSEAVDIAGWRMLLTHGHLPGLKINASGVTDEGMRRCIAAQGIDAVLFGHSHKPLVAWMNEGGNRKADPLRFGSDGTCVVPRDRSRVLLLNPGSAGPQRFKLPRCWYLLRLAPDHLEVERRDLV